MPKLPAPKDKSILDYRQLSDGRWLYKVSNRKGPGDFAVRVYAPRTKELPRGKRVTPTYAHFAIDLYGKLCRNSARTKAILPFIEELYGGGNARAVLSRIPNDKLQNFDSLPGYSVEYILQCLEFIFEQEDVNFEREYVRTKKPLPQIRRTLIRRGDLSEEEGQQGRALAMHLLRRVVRHGVHPVEAMHEVRLRI